MDAVEPTGSVHKTRNRGASRRGEILCAARRVFLTEGFERATIRKIAATVGVSSGTLYLYFPDKDAILRAIAESAFDALLLRLQDAARHPGTDLERFRASLHAYIGFGLEYPDEYRLTFLAKMMASGGPGRPATVCQGIQAANRSFDILTTGIEGLVRTGVFRPAAAPLTAEAVWACLHGATALLLDQADHIISDRNALITKVIEVILAGLSAYGNMNIDQCTLMTYTSPGL